MLICSRIAYLTGAADKELDFQLKIKLMLCTLMFACRVLCHFAFQKNLTAFYYDIIAQVRHLFFLG